MVAEVDVLDMNYLQVYFICLTLQGICKCEARGFNVQILQNELFEAFLILNHEFGDKSQTVERHIDEGHLRNIVIGVVIMAHSLVFESSLGRFGKERQDKFFYSNVHEAFLHNFLNMAVVDFAVAVERDVLDAWVDFGILE